MDWNENYENVRNLAAAHNQRVEWRNYPPPSVAANGSLFKQKPSRKPADMVMDLFLPQSMHCPITCLLWISNFVSMRNLAWIWVVVEFASSLVLFRSGPKYEKRIGMLGRISWWWWMTLILASFWIDLNH